MTHDPTPETAAPAAVQILTVIFYAGFAISVSIVAMALFGLIGIALAVFLAWQWGRVAVFGPAQPRLAPDTGEAPSPAPSGNAAFDAYRDDMLARLEAEQVQFEAFLHRLRHARDAEEFDRFMHDRNAAA
jgi:hypothetical protein